MLYERHVLVVDNDAEIRELLTHHLELASLLVHQAASGDEAIQSMKNLPIDLVILDIMMEKLDGFEVLEWMRSSHLDIPVILLSAKWEDDNKVHGFSLGADDYVTKPFSIMELVARVKVHLRRTSKQGKLQEFQPLNLTFGSLTLDLEEQTLQKNNQIIPLTATEAQLLYALMRNPNRVLTKAQIFNSVWRHEAYNETSLTVYISHLRKKIEDQPQHPKYIETVWGLGYRFKGSLS